MMEKLGQLLFGRGGIPGLLRTLLLGLHAKVLQVRRYLQGRTTQIPVYDLVNAGPRNRFSTGALIVHNCLGAGYGSGAAKFVSIAKTMADLTITPEESEAAIKGFRQHNPKITDLWSRFDRLIKSAIQDRERTLALELPTGDYLYHFHLQSYLKPASLGQKARGATKSFSIKGDYGHESVQPNLWGGVLTENITQRMARDVLAEAILNLEAAGLPVLFSSHDEVIIEVDDDASKTDAEKTALEIMRTPPEWAPGLPLEVEGGFERHYTK